MSKRKFSNELIQSQIEEPVKIMNYFEIVKKQVQNRVNSDNISNFKNLTIKPILESCGKDEHSFYIEVIPCMMKNVNLGNSLEF